MGDSGARSKPDSDVCKCLLCRKAREGEEVTHDRFFLHALHITTALQSFHMGPYCYFQTFDELCGGNAKFFKNKIGQTCYQCHIHEMDMTGSEERGKGYSRIHELVLNEKNIFEIRKSTIDTLIKMN